MVVNKNNFISIAKAIGIISMVVGHSGCPETVGKFLYSFHMPLFFFCSGYFFKEITYSSALKKFSAKRFRGLYAPYIKWSIGFLIMHNLFCSLNIYNETIAITPYTLSEYGRHFAKAILMTDYELLIRPFWFIKALLLASLLVAILSFTIHRFEQIHSKSPWTLFFIFILATTLCKSINLQIPIIGDLSVISFSALYICTGILYRNYEYLIPQTTFSLAIMFLTTLVGSILFSGEMDMRYTTFYNFTAYYTLSLIGIAMTLGFSKKLNTTICKNILYYIGNHTMPILAMNLIALKMGNLIKIWFYDFPISDLASYTVIYEHNSFFWIIYTMFGVSIPLLTNAIYQYFKQKVIYFLAITNNLFKFARKNKISHD